MPLIKTLCAHRDCIKSATHHIGFRAWAKGFPKSSAPFTAGISLMLCHPHAIEATKDVETIVTDEGWGQICAIIVQAGKALPDRASVELFTIKGDPKTAHKASMT